MKLHASFASLILCQQCTGFSHPSHHSAIRLMPMQMQNQPSTDVTWLSQSTCSNDKHLDLTPTRASTTRRDFTKVITASIISSIFLSNPEPSNADNIPPGTIWKTGKAPEVPGQKPKDKNDTKGTRKDPNFLRSIADCKGKCENSPGPDGLARSSGECLSACQDICCTTYEQCTFAIIAR